MSSSIAELESLLSSGGEGSASVHLSLLAAHVSSVNDALLGMVAGGTGEAPPPTTAHGIIPTPPARAAAALVRAAAWAASMQSPAAADIVLTALHGLVLLCQSELSGGMQVAASPAALSFARQLLTDVPDVDTAEAVVKLVTALSGSFPTSILRSGCATAAIKAVSLLPHTSKVRRALTASSCARARGRGATPTACTRVHACGARAVGVRAARALLTRRACLCVRSPLRVSRLACRRSAASRI
ncbi:hypothetical protein EON68_01240 [archaeon]|nr:MAG: hypothetical protein EON68_01240 [archaeon]